MCSSDLSEEDAAEESTDTVAESTENVGDSGLPKPEEAEKPEPIKEFFIAGTEPKGTAAQTDKPDTGDEGEGEGETKPNPAQRDSGLEGLF